MLTLALDAAAGAATVAVLRDTEILASAEAPPADRKSEPVLPTVVATLTRAGVAVADIGRVVCGDGPGGFTSLRLAAGTAKGIARGVGAELWVLPSLALVAAAAEPLLAAGDYLTLLDALRGECYAAPVTVAADGRVTRCENYRRMPRAAALEYALNANLTAIGPAEERAILPHARGIARVQWHDALVRRVSVSEWEPQYGRLAEAQVKWEALHKRPLVGEQQNA